MKKTTTTKIDMDEILLKIHTEEKILEVLFDLLGEVSDEEFMLVINTINKHIELQKNEIKKLNKQ